MEITDDHHRVVLRLVGYTLRPLLPLCSRHCVGWGAEVWVGVDDLVLDWKNSLDIPLLIGALICPLLIGALICPMLGLGLKKLEKSHLKEQDHPEMVGGDLRGCLLEDRGDLRKVPERSPSSSEESSDPVK